MNAPDQASREESRWPPALAILLVLFLMATLPGHVIALPVWVSYLATRAVLVPMVGVALTAGNPAWISIERTIIILFATIYVANTIVQLAEMVGIVTLHPGSAAPFIVTDLFGRHLGS